MGMFDNLRCEFPLPAPDAQSLAYQTKDTPDQWMVTYFIRPDGSLWHEVGADVSDGTPATGFARSDLTGEVRFYTGGGGRVNGKDEGKPWWLEFSAYFKDGQMQQVNLINDTRPAANPPTPKISPPPVISIGQMDGEKNG